VLGEFPTSGSARSCAHIVDAARAAGYASAWPWSLLADDTSTNGDAALTAVTLQACSADPDSRPQEVSTSRDQRPGAARPTSR
jgi:hypothetical protein